MPPEKESNKIIPRIYKQKYENLSMFFFVVGQRTIMPAITIEKAMYNYFRFIGETDFNIESALTTFSTLQKQFYENTKADK